MNQELRKKSSINLKDYSYESCQKEFSAGGTLSSISNLSYIPRNNFCIYKSKIYSQRLLKL